MSICHLRLLLVTICPVTAVAAASGPARGQAESASLAARTAIDSSRLGAVPLAAQSGWMTPAPVPRVAAPRQNRSTATSFLMELAGGTAGSLAGFGLGVLITNPEDCGSDDLLCYLEDVGIALAISGGTAGLGAVLAGRMADTHPSVPGAFVGSVAGIAAGLGVVHLISEEFDISRERAALWLGYTVTQGTVTALGSRVFAALRD
jgi:hypothetical protein